MSNRFEPNTCPSYCEKEVTMICESAKKRLSEENHLDIMQHEVAYTVTEVVLEEVASYLRNHPNDVIEFSSLLKFSTTRTDSENGEKGGNIVPLVEIGEKFKLGVKNDDETEEDDE